MSGFYNLAAALSVTFQGIVLAAEQQEGRCGLACVTLRSELCLSYIALIS